MTRENIKGAIERNLPFTVLMADGRECHVPHRDFISFSRKGTSVLISTEDDKVNILPLITMTGIEQEIQVEG